MYKVLWYNMCCSYTLKINSQIFYLIFLFRMVRRYDTQSRGVTSFGLKGDTENVNVVLMCRKRYTNTLSNSKRTEVYRLGSFAEGKEWKPINRFSLNLRRPRLVNLCERSFITQCHKRSREEERSWHSHVTEPPIYVSGRELTKSIRPVTRATKH